MFASLKIRLSHYLTFGRKGIACMLIILCGVDKA